MFRTKQRNYVQFGLNSLENPVSKSYAEFTRETISE